MKRFLMLLAILSWLLSNDPALASTPAQQLRKSIDEISTLVSIPDSENSSKRLEKRNQIFKVIENCFDLTEMSRRSLGDYYDRIPVKEQIEFDLAFSRLLEDAYVKNIARYRNSEIEIVSERPFGDKYYYVATQLASGKHTISIHYYLHQIRNQWLVYDVKIAGVSLVSDYRNKFRRTIKEKNFEGLMGVLKEQLRKLDEG